MLLLLGIATLISVWSFWRFGAQDSGEVALWEMTGQMAFDEVVTSNNTSVLRQNGRDAVVLMPGAQAQVTWDEVEDHLDVDLMQGEMLFATLAGDVTVSVSTDFARVDSQNNMAYVSLEDANMEVYALQHPSSVTFTLQGEDLNSIPVPTGHRVKVSGSKISSTIGRLRLTKLSKEFPAFALDEDDLTKKLVSEIMALEKAYETSSLNFLNDLQVNSEFGPAQIGFASKFSDGVQGFEQVVTVLPHANARLESNIEEEVLTYSMSNLLFGDKVAGDAWLLQWSQMPHNLAELQDLYASLFFVLPGDELYSVKSSAAEVVYSSDDAFTSLRRQYQEIENLVQRASLVQAEAAYDAYKAEFLANLDLLDDLSREYILLELLLRDNELFYTVEDTELLTALEVKILSFAGSDQDLDEERQAFIQSKLRFLGNLFDFVIEKVISPVEATDLANELLFQAESYMSDVSSQVAVSEYFESELAAYELSIQFMTSPEFYSYESFDEGLLAYGKKVDDLNELNNYLQNLRTGQIENEDLDPGPNEDDAIDEVEKALKNNEIQFATVVSLGDAANRLFEIVGARTGGYAFDANYDRETGILYDVVADDVRFSTGILLESASEVITLALEEEIVVEEVEEVETVEVESSLAEGVALDFVESQFEEAGLNLDDFEISLTDLESNLFSFSGVISSANLPVSGVYISDTGRVMGVVWEYNELPQTFPDVDLEQLEGAIMATYEALEASQ